MKEFVPWEQILQEQTLFLKGYRFVKMAEKWRCIHPPLSHIKHSLYLTADLKLSAQHSRVAMVREKCLENRNQGKVREFCGWSGKSRKDLESQGKVREFENKWLWHADFRKFIYSVKEGKGLYSHVTI